MTIKSKIAILIIILFFPTAKISISSVYAAIEKVEKYAESRCSEYEGEWEDGRCEIEDKEQEFLDDVQKIEEFEEENADLEDALCYDSNGSDRYPKICKPWLFED